MSIPVTTPELPIQRTLREEGRQGSGSAPTADQVSFALDVTEPAPPIPTSPMEEMDMRELEELLAAIPFADVQRRFSLTSTSSVGPDGKFSLTVQPSLPGPAYDAMIEAVVIATPTGEHEVNTPPFALEIEQHEYDPRWEGVDGMEDISAVPSDGKLEVVVHLRAGGEKHFSHPLAPTPDGPVTLTQPLGLLTKRQKRLIRWK